MAISRYQLRGKALNKNKLYDETFKKRGVKYVKHYRTPNLRFPTQKELKRIESVEHIWKLGDRYEKLAFDFYGDPEYWWVIAWFNRRPTDFQNRIGDVIYIPLALEDAIKAFGV
tara:strand:+ start:622 stop:963 length:342 start_codon:yes stop_codon:yes gene_type:complete